MVISKLKNFIFILAGLIMLMFFSTGFNYSREFEKKVLVIYPQVSEKTRPELIDYYINYMENTLVKLDYKPVTRHFLDLYYESNNKKPGDELNFDSIKQIAIDSNCDLIIYTIIDEYRANRSLKPGLAILEPVTLNTTIAGTVKIDSIFIDVENFSNENRISVEKYSKNRVLGMVTLKKYLLQKTLRECIGETLYLAQKKELL
jgi:hypothetical protein